MHQQHRTTKLGRIQGLGDLLGRTIKKGYLYDTQL
jgi:hypothetical protein